MSMCCGAMQQQDAGDQRVSCFLFNAEAYYFALINFKYFIACNAL